MVTSHTQPDKMPEARDIQTFLTELESHVKNPNKTRAWATDTANTWVKNINTAGFNVTNSEDLTKKIQDLLLSSNSFDEERKAALALLILSHIQNGVTMNVPLPEGVPEIKDNYVETASGLRLRIKTIGGMLTVALSTTTSLASGYSIAGAATTHMTTNYAWTNELYAQDPQIRTLINLVLGSIIGVAITQGALTTFRRNIEEISYGGNKSFTSATRTALKDMFKRNSKVLGIAVMAGLVWDLISNADGFVSLTAGKTDEAQQIHEIKNAVAETTKNIRDLTNQLPTSMANAGDDVVDKILEAEKAGRASSGKSGEGPVYQVKDLLLNGATPKGTVPAKYQNVLDTTELDTDTWNGLNPHIGYVVTEAIAPIRDMLTTVTQRTDELNAANNAETNAVHIKSIQTTLEEIDKILGPEGAVKEKIEKLLTEYNVVLEGLANAANSGNNTLIDTDTIAMPSIAINLPEMEIKNFEWKTTIALMKELIEKKEYGLAMAWLILAMSLAVLASYGDEIADEITPESSLSGNRVRTSHEKDREAVEAAKIKLKKLMTAYTTSLSSLLNGPFLGYLHNKKIHPDVIKNALEQALQEQLHPSQKKRGNPNGLQEQICRLAGDTWHSIIVNPANICVLGPLRRLTRKITTGNTPVADAHNEEVKAFARVMQPPNLLKVLGEILSEANPRKRNVNDTNIQKMNVEVLKAQIQTIRDGLPKNPTTDTHTIGGRKDQINHINALEAVLEKAKATDPETYGDAEAVNNKNNLIKEVERAKEEALKEIQKGIRETLQQMTQRDDSIDESIPAIGARIKAFDELKAEIAGLSTKSRQSNISLTRERNNWNQIILLEITTLQNKKTAAEEKIRRERATQEAQAAATREATEITEFLNSLDEFIQKNERPNTNIAANNFKNMLGLEHIKDLTTIRNNPEERSEIQNAHHRCDERLREIIEAKNLNQEQEAASKLEEIKSQLQAHMDNLMRWYTQ